MKRIILSAVTFAVMGSAASAATYVLDFDADPTNAAEVASLDSSATQTISSPRDFTDSGVTWRVESSGGAGVGLFDTTCSYGFGTNGCAGDADLEVFNQMNAEGVAGNVLIQQEAGNPGRPDDDANTSFLTLTLLTDITLEWTGASALDDGFYLFNFGAQLLGTVDNGNGSAFDNTTGSVDFASTALLTQNDTITVFFQRSATDTRGASGAVDNFRFNVVPAVPVPASLPLLVGGFGLMAFMHRRRKA
ncbi:VPLPA-CTERM sorting domain-containing protein [uncultured Tateyamaria sp.]|uniref:VPLPA-CTERM sorting domain-containing protein n=1 Tax=uncultured Tateyamaria sp. TaxID=455651 RepID=UPI00262AE7CC|nr:VPLPA-CTERM sorting domain-containing protein [uncultured Tateyamaria sp.]